MTTHRERMGRTITVVQNCDSREVVKLRSALVRIAEAAKGGEDTCKAAAATLPWRMNKLAEGFNNLATHFTYIREIAQEASDGE